MKNYLVWMIIKVLPVDMACEFLDSLFPGWTVAAIAARRKKERHE